MKRVYSKTDKRPRILEQCQKIVEIVNMLESKGKGNIQVPLLRKGACLKMNIINERPLEV